jgi:hypothetical protein
VGAGVFFTPPPPPSAGVLGWGVVSDDEPLAAKLFSGFFLCSAVGAFWLGRMTRTPADASPAR